MIGQFLVHLAFAASLVSVATYAVSIWRRSEEWRFIGRTFFSISATLLGVVAVMHVSNILNHRFEYTYVWQHSSRELSFPLLLASSYAGQEGSFLLWALWVVLVGVGVLWYARKYRLEAAVMVWYGAILAFLLLLMVAKNPFAYVWETYAADGVEVGMIPPNGRGLNPLLHNLWITIHPPMLFLGFAAMGVPFAFAMAALLRRDYQNWAKIVFPWVLFAAGVLGLGIMLGGFWAYETLGWGGFWGWDPVENSSLIPWLIAVVLVHTMLTQLRTGGLFKTNILLAVASFLFVLYSTFLTRSGVLGDTSVHSFVDPGYFAYVLLLGGMIFFAGASISLLWLRRTDWQRKSLQATPVSREFWIGVGVILLLAITVVILVGTSWPIFLELVGQPKVAIEPSFYNKMTLPLAILLLAVNAVSLVLRWKVTPKDRFWKQLLVYSTGAAIATGGIAIVTQFTNGIMLLFVFATLLALLVNVEWLWQMLRRRPLLIGAYLSHFGVAILFIGVIAYSQFQQQTHLQLPQGEPRAFGDYQFTFLQKVQVEKELQDREKYEYHIEVRTSSDRFVLKPVLFWSSYNNWEAAFLEPGIAWGIRSDLYIAPKAVEVHGQPRMVQLMKGESASHPFDSTWTVHFVGFDMSQAQGVQGRTAAVRLGAKVRLVNTMSAITIDTTVWSTMRGKRWTPEELKIPGTSLAITLEKIIPDRENLARSKVSLALYSYDVPESVPREVFVAEITIKPLIGLVWIGTVLTVLGFFVAVLRRWREIRRRPQRWAEVSVNGQREKPEAIVEKHE